MLRGAPHPTPTRRALAAIPRCLGALLLCALWSPAALAQGTDDEAAAQASDRGVLPADAPKIRGDAAMKKELGALFSAEAEDDLRLGPFRQPERPYPFPLLGDAAAKDIYVDRAGRLYRERKYQGVVPNLEGPRRRQTGRCAVDPQLMTWVGFQNGASSSRIFVQVEQTACGYVYRPDAKHVVIDLPGVSPSTENIARDILTGAYPTAVQLVRIREVPGRGTRVTIALKEPRRYLSAHVGRYVFVDIAR